MDEFVRTCSGVTVQSSEASIKSDHNDGDVRQLVSSVVFLPRHPTSWSKMVWLAQIVSKCGRFRPVFILASNDVVNYAEECDQLGFEYVITSSRNAPSLERPRPLSIWRLLRRQYREFRQLLQKIAPIAVVMPGDRELWPVPSMLRAACDSAIPTLNAAFSVVASDAVAQNRLGDPRFRVEWKHRPPFINYLVASLLPGQVRDTRLGKMLFSPGWLTLTLAAARMLPRNPWVQGGGHSSLLLVSGPKVAQDAQARGVPPEKISVIGDPAVDALYESWLERDHVRERLAMQHGFDVGRKLLICAVPIYAEHNLMDWPPHLADLQSAFQAMKDKDVDILLSLHPKSDANAYAEIFNQFGLEISDEPLRDILPAADIFVCGGSSTLFWAGYCGIPAINLDFSGVASVGMQSSDGMVYARTAGDVTRALSTWLSQPDKYDQAVALQASQNRQNVLFDGCASDRLLALLDTLQEDCCASQ